MPYRVRLEEPVGHHAVFGHAVEHAVGADDRRVDRARAGSGSRRPRRSAFKRQLGPVRPDDVHRQAADQVVAVRRACARRRE